MTPERRSITDILCVGLMVAVVAFAGSAEARRLALNGELIAVDAQPLIVPQSSNSPVNLRKFVADGTRVKKGDVVLTIDPGGSEQQLRTLNNQIEQLAARLAREIAVLQVAAIDAELALIDAEAALAKARLDAAIPKAHLSALDYDRYQGEFARASRDFDVRTQERESARAAVARREADGKLETERMVAERDFHRLMVAGAEVRASLDGVVVAGTNRWSGQRIVEGSSVQVGNEAGKIIGDGGRVIVRAYALEADKDSIAVGAPVSLKFDALPDRQSSRIERVAAAPDQKREWGEGRYIAIDIPLPDGVRPGMTPGMSVRVELGTEPSNASAAVPAPATLTVDGEVYAQRSSDISPPAIDDLWQLTLVQIAPDGASIKAGQPVAVFEGSSLVQRLASSRSSLKEKQSQRERLVLELAELERQQAVDVEAARAERDKAARKAEQPEDLIGRVEYQKLVVDRERTAARYRRQVERSEASAQQRAADRGLVEAEVRQLEAELAMLETAQRSLMVPAPRDGLVLHMSNWQGEKFAAGSAVFRGQTVAQIPDPSSLAVRALVPERDYLKLRPGAKATVRSEGGAGVNLVGEVVDIGRVVRSRSRVQPEPIVDAIVRVDGATGLRPGQPVRVEIEVGGEP